jgi:hypothetical protein
MRLAMQMKAALETPESKRDVNWVRDHLQTALALELSTLPPYLTAFWSIKDPGVIWALLSSIAKQEMLHLGLVCNCLNALRTRPRIAFAEVVQTYPAHLPGGVHVDLLVPLQRFSLEAIASIFMKIEEPLWKPSVTFGGEEWPTIGAFYEAIVAAVEKLSAKQFAANHKQIEVPDPPLFAVNSKKDCLAALNTIMVQGEGTDGNPKYGPAEDDIAHYYKFAEILHGRKFIQLKKCWSYAGDEIPRLNPKTDIYPMADVPPEGYPQSLKFDWLFTEMLLSLQNAWDTGSADILIQQAETYMTNMTIEARALMQLPKLDGSGETYGPTFRFLGGLK